MRTISDLLVTKFWISWMDFYDMTIRWVALIVTRKETTNHTAQERLTAQEAMDHPYFDPVRQASSKTESS